MSDTSSPYSVTETILEERRRNPSYGRLKPQLFVGFLACLSSISFGTTLGWSHPTSQQLFLLDEKVSSEELTLLLTISLLGCSFGVGSSGIFIKQWGPKRSMQIIGVFYIANWWLLLIPNTKAQLTGRFFLGFFGICYCRCCEILYLQTVHHRIRRCVAVFQNSAMVFGVSLSHVVGAALSPFVFTAWCSTIPILHYLLIQIVPESPVFLFPTSHLAAAKSLEWYRGRGNFYEDMANLKKDWDMARHDTDSYGYMFFAKVVFRGLIIVMGVTFFQAFAGYFIFLFYEIRVWGNKTLISNVADSSIGAVFFVVSRLVWGSVHGILFHRVRPWLISSGFFSALALTAITVYLVLDEFQIDFVEYLCWTPMVAMFSFIFCFEMGLNYFPKILIFEYMPFQVYKRAFATVQFLYWLVAFLNIYCFAKTYLTVPSYIIFGVLAVITYVGTLFCYIFVVEPRGKSLVQVQLELGGNPVGKRGALYNQIKRNL